MFLKILIIELLFIFPIATFAGMTARLEPSAGYTMSHKPNPSRNIKSVTYGLKASAGFEALALETEYNQGEAKDDIPSLSQTSTIKTTRMRAGLRSDIPLFAPYYFRIKGGAEKRRTVTDSTISGRYTHFVTPYSTYPYVGIGAGMNTIGVHLVAEVTATLINKRKLNEAEITPSISVVVGF